jgi:hypothetical protein
MDGAPVRVWNVIYDVSHFDMVVVERDYVHHQNYIVCFLIGTNSYDTAILEII